MTATAPADGARRAPAFRWDHLTVTLALGYALNALALGINTVLAELRSDLALSSTVTSLHGSFFGWGLVVAGSLGAGLVARVGRRRTFVAATVAEGIGAVLFATGANVTLTLLGALFVGAGAACMVTVVPGVVSDRHGEARAAAFSAVNAFPAAAGLAAPALIGFSIGQGWGWNLAYAVPAVAFAVAVTVRARAADWPVERPERPSPWPLLRARGFRKVWLLVVVGVMAEFGIAVWGVTFLREVGGASDGMAPVLGTAFAVGIGAGRLLTAPLLRVRTVPSLVGLGFAVATAGGVIMLVPSLPLRCLGFLLVGLGLGPVYPLGVDRMFAVAGDDDAGVSLACALASGAAITLGPLAVGVAADQVGLGTAMVLVPAFAGAGLLLTRRVLAR